MGPTPSSRELRLELLDVAEPALGRHVAAVEEAVHEDVVGPARLGHLEQRVQVLAVAVHAAVGDAAP